jgi:hypothetical protein
MSERAMYVTVDAAADTRFFSSFDRSRQSARSVEQHCRQHVQSDQFFRGCSPALVHRVALKGTHETAGETAHRLMGCRGADQILIPRVKLQHAPRPLPGLASHRVATAMLAALNSATPNLIS